MNKVLRPKAWRQRYYRCLVSVGVLVLVGVSWLQLNALLRHRPQNPEWALELAQHMEVLTDESSSGEERASAMSEIQDIAQEKLKETAALAEARSEARQFEAQFVNTALIAALSGAQNLTQTRTLASARVETRSLHQAISLALSRSVIWDQKRDLALSQDLALPRTRELSEVLT